MGEKWCTMFIIFALLWNIKSIVKYFQIWISIVKNHKKFEWLVFLTKISNFTKCSFLRKKKKIFTLFIEWLSLIFYCWNSIGCPEGNITLFYWPCWRFSSGSNGFISVPVFFVAHLQLWWFTTVSWCVEAWIRAPWDPAQRTTFSTFCSETGDSWRLPTPCPVWQDSLRSISVGGPQCLPKVWSLKLCKCSVYTKTYNVNIPKNKQKSLNYGHFSQTGRLVFWELSLKKIFYNVGIEIFCNLKPLKRRVCGLKQ